MVVAMSPALFNSYSLHNSGHYETVQKVLHSALEAADPMMAIRRKVVLEGDYLRIAEREYFLNEYNRVFLIGFGKAALSMTKAMMDILGDWVKGGIVISKLTGCPDEILLPETIRVLKGSHPVPDENSVYSTQALVEFVKETQPNDLVICLISGGGSALLTLPVEGVGLEDIRSLTNTLLACGAEIGEINTLRKHLDQVKGGGLAHMIFPAQLITLILSDVIGSPLDVIASGPTVADPTTYEDAIKILRKYRIEGQVPVRIMKVLQAGRQGRIDETVKPGEECLQYIQNMVVSSNVQAAKYTLEVARREGLNANLLTTFLHGEANQAGMFLGGIIRQIATSGQPMNPPACLVVGGETTVTLRGNGLGGRNMELALGAVYDIAGLEKSMLITLATDGEDGPTDAAGAVVTGQTLDRGRRAGLNPSLFLQNNDSYHYFERLNDLLKTGPTGTNVNDLAFLFVF